MMLMFHLLFAVGSVAAFQPQPNQQPLTTSRRIATTLVKSYDTDSGGGDYGNGGSGGDGWSVADNWETLSAENPINSVPDTRSIFNQDIAQNAANSMMMKSDIKLSEEEEWLDDIIGELVQEPLSSTPLYDTRLEEEVVGGGVATKTRKSSGNNNNQLKDFEEQMGEEIALLVRCNESPEDMLVRAGRAVAPLTEEEQEDVAQLVFWNDKNEKDHWMPTPFFQQAIAKMFQMHADTQTNTMDAKSMSRWMTQSLGNELDSYTEKQHKNGKDMTSVVRQQKTIAIGPHDSRVLKTLSKYAEYGTGRLTLDNFEQLYVDALTINANGMALVGPSVDTLKLLNADHIRQVWRDLANHKIVGPNQQTYNQEQAKMQAEYGTLQEQTKRVLKQLDDSDFMDECEILEYSYEAPPSKQQQQAGHDTKNDKYIRKSSHEHVKLAADGKTPLYMEEGSFVFIDEETCIGCMQVRVEVTSLQEQFYARSLIATSFFFL